MHRTSSYEVTAYIVRRNRTGSTRHSLIGLAIDCSTKYSSLFIYYLWLYDQWPMVRGMFLNVLYTKSSRTLCGGGLVLFHVAAWD